MADLDAATREKLEAAAFRRLVKHLGDHPDVQNLTLMTHGGFCRNCLADWLKEAAAGEGLTLDKAAARELVYGEPYEDWKARHAREPSDEEMVAFRAAQARFGHG